MVHAVDDDQSGTIDFEEFTLLMLRSERLAIAPDWLCALLEDDMAAPNEVRLQGERLWDEQVLLRKTFCVPHHQLDSALH